VLKIVYRMFLVLLLLQAAGCVTRLGPGSSGWKMIGEQQVGPGADHDVFPVGAQFGQFRELRIDARGGSVDVNDMVVTFGDGTTFRPNFRAHFDDRSRGQTIDLPGNRRTIQKIDFNYTATQPGVFLIVEGR
jgi:hypothetical protein